MSDTTCKDLDEVCQSRKEIHVAKSKVADANTKLDIELDGRTISEWDDDEKKISNIDSTRPLETVIKAIEDIRIKEKLLTAKHSEHADFIKVMEGKWSDQQTLEEEIAEDRTNLKTDQDNLTNCPAFPEGFTKASAFEADIKMREEKVEEKGSRSNGQQTRSPHSANRATGTMISSPCETPLKRKSYSHKGTRNRRAIQTHH